MSFADHILKFIEHLGATVLLDQGACFRDDEACVTDGKFEVELSHRQDPASGKQPKLLERTLTDTSSDDSEPYGIEDEFEALAKINLMEDMMAKPETAYDLAAIALDLRLEITKLNQDLCKETVKLKADKTSAKAEIRSLRREVAQLKSAAKTSMTPVCEWARGG